MLLCSYRQAEEQVVLSYAAYQHGAGNTMPELGAWINHSATWLYWAENMSDRGGHPHQQSDLPELLAETWRNSTRQSWCSFLGVGLVGAASAGNLDGVNQLISAGATLRSKDRDGFTPLHRASHAGHANVVFRLLADKDDAALGPEPNGQTRLLWQRSKDGPFLVPSVSLKKKSTVDARDNLGSCPLHLAAARGNAYVVQLLLHNGADPSCSNGLQQTPLHTAATCAFGNSTGSICLLLDAGGDVMARDNAGRTPLHAAAYGGAQAAVSVLVSAGAKTEARGSVSSRTPLHEACARLRADSVQQLLDLGADECAVDSDGRTPGDMAGEWVQPEEMIAPTMSVLVRRILDRAPKDRIWRRRRLLLLIRRGTLTLKDQTEEDGLHQTEEDGLRQTGSGVLSDTHFVEGNVHQTAPDVVEWPRSVVAIVSAVEEGVFRNIVSYL